MNGKTELHGEGGEAGYALRRIQEFDPQTLVREQDLGKRLALTEVVEPTTRVIDLFKLISTSQVDYFPQNQQNILRDQANAFFNLLTECLQFDIENATPTPTEAKNNLVNRIEAQFQPVFDQLYPLISFASIRSLDFSKLERDARAATQAARDSGRNLLDTLAEDKRAVDVIVSEMRALAAEQGVSKQAIYFKNEADEHREQSTTWRNYTLALSGILILYSISSLFFHYIDALNPTSYYQAGQLAVSKIMIFGVLAYLLIISARNFLSHKHNEVVNRHRQNALATFAALAEATSDAASSDIVLSHAAACIFSPQETGYAKQEGSHGDSVPALQLLPRIAQISGASH